jgi:hypothetical protein
MNSYPILLQSIPNTLLILGIAIIVFSLFSKIKEEHLID